MSSIATSLLSKKIYSEIAHRYFGVSPLAGVDRALCVRTTYLALVHHFEMHGRRIWFGVHLEVNFQFGIGFGKSWVLHSPQQFLG
jgi:hypothetical protein